MRRLADTSIAFERAIARATGKPHIVNSSKEPTRGMMLLRFCPEARVIHLVRDPRRLMASNYWRFKDCETATSNSSGDATTCRGG